jgi:uncharacterized membrane protein (UPF0127 family)
MALKKRTQTYAFAGGLTLLVGAGCLLWLLGKQSTMSDRPQALEAVSDMAASTTLSDIRAQPSFEMVSTEAAREKGLGGRSSIPDNYAMVFTFPTNGKYGFWMKDMLTSIDIIWVSADGTIASVTPSVATSTYPHVFYPPVPIRYVLETQSGFAARSGWSVGTRIPLPSSLLPTVK